jgi:hypothetical protein
VVIVTLLFLVACSPSAASPTPAPAPAPVPSASAPPVPSPAPPPALLTDDECIAKGGRVITEQTYAYLDRRHDPDRKPAPFRVCRIPSPKNGHACAGEADCDGGRCFCTGEFSRPDPENDPALLARDGQAGTGRCSDEPVESGAWWCLVEGGKVHVQGFIVD